MGNILRETGATVAEADQCTYGLKAWGEHKSQIVIVKKPTTFMMESQAIGRQFSRICDGIHGRHPLLDARAKGAARYPPAFGRVISHGILKYKMQRAYGVTAMLSINEGPHMNNVHPEEHQHQLILGIPSAGSRPRRRFASEPPWVRSLVTLVRRALDPRAALLA